jgi:hypothetical protein
VLCHYATTLILDVCFPATRSNLTALLACFSVDLTTFIRSVLFLSAFVLFDRLRGLDSFGGLFRLYSLSLSACLPFYSGSITLHI